MNFSKFARITLLGLGLTVASSAQAAFTIYNYSSKEFANYWISESGNCVVSNYINTGLLSLNGGFVTFSSPGWSVGTRLCVTITTPSTRSSTSNLNPYNCAITIRDNWYSPIVSVTLSSGCYY